MNKILHVDREPVEMLSFFLVLKLSNNSTVELLHRAKGNENNSLLQGFSYRV